MKLERLKVWREARGFTQKELSRKAQIAEKTVARIELGDSVRPNTARKVADALGVEVTDLLERPPVPLAEAPVTGRRTAWESAVENARGLRASGQARMTELLSFWRASMERQEEKDARREYRLEMADLLTQAHKAKTDLFRNLTWWSKDARRAYKETKEAGAREVPNADWEEFLEADRFYYRLRWMLEDVGLTVLTGDAAAAAEQATADEAAAEQVQAETTPHRVEELDIAV